VRSDIRPFVPTPCREVLEVGCGRGATGHWLQQETGCRVTGVELNPVVAKAASAVLHRVVAGDVLSVEIGGSYDWILALELFEHLVEPLEFLERAERLLEPGGRILLSVPNVGHYSIVEDLLAGRWDYLPIGLLCSTHYRFFTRRTLVDWLVGAGFEHFEIVPQRTEVPERMLRLPLPVDAESLGTKGFYVQIERRRR
jgi:2-polyprenyl-3-methyl-5-hydroxy-6-metoxy-1,4-benzoquinol methylase